MKKDPIAVASNSTEPEDKFCVNPFLELSIRPTGTASPCCAFVPIEQDGRPMSVYNHSTEEIWNSEDWRSLRKNMVEGKPLGPCSYCHDHEKLGGESMRMAYRRAWEAGWLNPRGETIEDMKANAIKNDFVLENGPEWLDLDVGNLCNLKCRMCQVISSSSIANDPVHSGWTSFFADSVSIPRWRGRSMTIAPMRVQGLEYNGFSPLDNSGETPLVWIHGGDATIDIRTGAQEVAGVQIKISAVPNQPCLIEIFANAVSVYREELSTAQQTFDFPEAAIGADALKIRIQCSAPVAVEELNLLKANIGPAKVAFSRFPSGKQWFQDEEFLFQELLSNTDKLTKLNFIGGETFLSKDVVSIMEYLIARGVAKDITLSLLTNGTIANEEIYRLSAQFKSLILGVSLDGYGEVNDYIRFPAQWASIEPNIKRLQQIENAYVYVNMTIQAYNMLHVSALVQYCQEMDLCLQKFSTK